MGSVKVAVSLPQTLFDRLRSLAAETHVPRSTVVAAALSDYLERREVECLRERINAACADGPDADERAALEAGQRMERRRAVPGEW